MIIFPLLQKLHSPRKNILEYAVIQFLLSEYYKGRLFTNNFLVYFFIFYAKKEITWAQDPSGASILRNRVVSFRISTPRASPFISLILVISKSVSIEPDKRKISDNGQIVTVVIYNSPDVAPFIWYISLASCRA